MWSKPLVRDFSVASGRTGFPPNISRSVVCSYRDCDNAKSYFLPPDDGRNNAETLILCFFGPGSLSEDRAGFLASAASCPQRWRQGSGSGASSSAPL